MKPTSWYGVVITGDGARLLLDELLKLEEHLRVQGGYARVGDDLSSVLVMYNAERARFTLAASCDPMFSFSVRLRTSAVVREQELLTGMWRPKPTLTHESAPKPRRVTRTRPGTA